MRCTRLEAGYRLRVAALLSPWQLAGQAMVEAPEVKWATIVSCALPNVYKGHVMSLYSNLVSTVSIRIRTICYLNARIMTCKDNGKELLCH